MVVEDPAGHQLEGEALSVDHDRVPGVVAALVADHQVHLLGDEVGELPLALVAPLGRHSPPLVERAYPRVPKKMAGPGPPLLVV